MDKTVLIVEDDADVRYFISLLLHRSGWTVLELGSAKEAISRCEQHVGPITLMVADVHLPDMTGPEMARVVMATRPDLKVLFVTGATSSDMPAEAVVLQKPFSLPDLHHKVNEALADR